MPLRHITPFKGVKIMLQAKEIEKKFTQIEQSIVAASKACLDAKDTSPELKECMTKLGKQSTLAKQAMQSSDETKIRRFVNELELLGDQAEKACSKDVHATQGIKTAVSKVHNDLSNLKQQLH
jgi:hypothetical protein